MKKIILVGIIVIILLFTINSCSGSGKKELERKAISYFTEKYNINKDDIKVINNYLYGKDKTCIDACGNNELIINYQNNEYKIEYNRDANFFGDNYQYDEIYNDFNKYLNNKFSFSSKITSRYIEFDEIAVPVKYNGNIKNYFDEIKAFDNSHMYLHYGSDFVARDITTWVDIWLKADNKEQAKNLNTTYSKMIANELNSLGVNYNLAISTKSDDNEYSAFYYYHAYNDQCYLTDKVDNHRTKCDR